MKNEKKLSVKQSKMLEDTVMITIYHFLSFCGLNDSPTVQKLQPKSLKNNINECNTDTDDENNSPLGLNRFHQSGLSEH